MDQVIPSIEGIQLNPLKIIFGEHGFVLHVLKKNALAFKEFGEAYFSSVEFNKVKAWRKHHQMTLNLVVPVGKIRFVVFDDRKDSVTKDQFFEVTLSRDNYQRLTVSPGLWMGFQGLDEGLNLLLNVASIPHDPLESTQCLKPEIPYNW